MQESDMEPTKIVKQGSSDGYKISESGRNRKRTGSVSKTGRSLLLLMAAVVCALLLTGRLLWCFTYLVNGDETAIFVEPHRAKTRRENALVLDNSESQGSIKTGEIFPRAAGQGDIKDKELEFEEGIKDKIANDVRGSSEGITNAQEKLDAEIKIGEETTGTVNIELNLGDEGDMDGKEAPTIHNGDPVRIVRMDKFPDAITFLKMLAANLTSKEAEKDDGPYHSRRIFESDFAAMKRNFRIFVYPYDSSDPFHAIFQATDAKEVPWGNYASEEFFHQALLRSGYTTKDPSKADFFFMPISITKARLNNRIGVGGLQKFCTKYVLDLRSHWSYWNRSSGTDHFYLSCHSIARNAMDGVPEVRQNAIQLLCPASYFLAYYVTHKDASVPQIWPRSRQEPKEVGTITQRTRLAFFAGALNSPVRQELKSIWGKDDKILVYDGRTPFPYSKGLLTSKFCLHVKGFEVNTARLGDAMYYGCVPVVIANHYDLPFQDILDWTKFSLVVSSLDIPQLKDILEAVTPEQYLELHKHVLQARKHFIWHTPPEEHDAFNTVMYELWKRRHTVGRPS